MITAKILEYDTTMTRLKVTLVTENGEYIKCWVLDQMVNKLFDEKYSNEYHEYDIAKSDGHNWINSVD